MTDPEAPYRIASQLPPLSSPEPEPKPLAPEPEPEPAPAVEPVEPAPKEEGV